MAVFKSHLGGKEMIGYADPATNHNLGDQLLWAGSEKLFQRFGKRSVVSCGGSQSKGIVKTCVDQKDEIVKLLGEGRGVLWFNPGGNWGDLYRHVQSSRFDVWTLAHDNGIKFISGPQSIWYNPDSPKGAKKDIEFVLEMQSKKDVLAFRQHDSFLYAAKNYNSSIVVESPDIAFMLGPQVEHDKTKVDVFLLVRTDGESRMIEHLENYDKVCKGIMGKGYTCAIGDWGSGAMNRHKVGKDFAEDVDPSDYYSDIGVQLAISTVSIGELIVTDRLHGAILAFLLGKTVIYIDNSYKKLASVFNTAFRNKESCADTKTFGLFEAMDIHPRDLEHFIIKLLAKKRVM